MQLPRVLFVTGKGGTGKSTVAAALAVALSQRRSTVLADLSTHLGAAALLGAARCDDQTVRLSESLEAVALSQRAELNSFIKRLVPLTAISERMLRSRTFGYVTAALPGLEAFLLLERLRMMAGEAALHDRYVVIDAPATGTALELLAVATAVKGVAPVGTLRRLADDVQEFLTDPHRFAVLITVTPEDLSVRETLATAETLKSARGIEVAGAILNRSTNALFEEHELEQLGALQAHRLLAQRRLAERASAISARRELKRAGLVTFELPMLYRAAIGRREISALARVLAAGLVAP
jgi:arsenite/tail-anchored protein-transporting ATPase